MALKVWVFPYERRWKKGLKKGRRRGFLLRLQTPDFESGYGDCFPWPELGDPTVEYLLAAVEKKHWAMPLLEKTFACAQWDGEARAQKQFLLTGQEGISNHYLWTSSEPLEVRQVERIVSAGFRKVKLKIGPEDFFALKNTLKGFAQWAPGISLRLDFNGRLTAEFENLLLDYHRQIEFIEDPFPQVDERWAQLREKTKVALAVDFARSEDWQGQMPFLRICKPARDEIPSAKDAAVFTSYLGHPLGQAHDMARALTWGKQKTEYGLMSHQVYESCEFSQAIAMQGNAFVIPGNYGLGFESQLEGLPWRSIS